MVGSLIGKVKRRMALAQHKRWFLNSVEHVHGPDGPMGAQDDVTVVALVRNGSYYIDVFLEHYRALGAGSFVFCDNGSTDDTIERLRAEPDCAVLQSLLPWGEVENDFRRYAAERYAQGRWCLYADMDELFAFEGDAQVGLAGLTRYLDQEGYTALIAQMLEMVPKGPLIRSVGLTYAEAVEAYRWYDLREVSSRAYHDPQIGFSWYLQQNTVPIPSIDVKFGGLRKRVFGENCCLTKHPLVRITEGVEPGVHPHAAAHVSCGDFTALIRHYKFAGDTAARDADSLARGVIPHGEDRARLTRFAETPELSLWSEEAVPYEGLAPLYDAGFLVRSAQYDAYLGKLRA